MPNQLKIVFESLTTIEVKFLGIRVVVLEQFLNAFTFGLLDIVRVMTEICYSNYYKSYF